MLQIIRVFVCFECMCVLVFVSTTLFSLSLRSSNINVLCLRVIVCSCSYTWSMCPCVWIEIFPSFFLMLIWLFVHDFSFGCVVLPLFPTFFQYFLFIKKGVSYKMNFTNKTISPHLSWMLFACFFLLIAVNNYVTVTDFLFPSCILENLN